MLMQCRKKIGYIHSYVGYDERSSGCMINNNETINFTVSNGANMCCTCQRFRGRQAYSRLTSCPLIIAANHV